MARRREAAVAQREAWIAWRTRIGENNLGKTGPALRALLLSRWYRIPQNRRAGAAAQARRARGMPLQNPDPSQASAPALMGANQAQAQALAAGPAPAPAPAPAPVARPAGAEEEGDDRDDEDEDGDANQRSADTPGIPDLYAPQDSESVEPKAYERERLRDYGNIEKEEARNVAADRYRTNFDDLGKWEPGWNETGIELGSGGMGIVFLHLRKDEGEIVDRMVAKDCHVEHPSWTQYWKWKGNPADPENRTHMEIYCMKQIKRKEGSNKCVEIRHEPLVDDSRLFYRIYMRYYPHEDLLSLVKTHEDPEKDYHADVCIPEPAIWSFAGDLVDALLVLQYGDTRVDHEVEGWEPIVHRDMKLANVMLDSPGAKAEFPGYPTAVLGDFGLAVMTDENDRNNPVAFNDGSGTLCWRAPEQEMYAKNKALKPSEGPKLGEKTNVWGLGAIIIRLMNQEPKPKGPTWRPDNLEAPCVNGKAEEMYSRDLYSLMQDCASYVPSERPTLRELQRWVREWSTAGHSEGDRAQGLRVNEIEDDSMKLRYSGEQDRYKLRLASE